MHKVTRSFPKEEQFRLTNQVRRAAVSIAANIAEGSGRLGKKDQAHFDHIAYASSLEVLSHRIIASDLGLIIEADLLTLRNGIEEITTKLNAIRKAILKNA